MARQRKFQDGDAVVVVDLPTLGIGSVDSYSDGLYFVKHAGGEWEGKYTSNQLARPFIVGHSVGFAADFMKAQEATIGSLQSLPTSPLPTDPVERLKAIQNLASSGYLEPYDGKSLLDFPELTPAEVTKPKTIHTLDLMTGVRFGIIPNITRVSTKAVVDAPSQLKVKSIVEDGDRIVITTINDAETIIFPANQKSAERA